MYWTDEWKWIEITFSYETSDYGTLSTQSYTGVITYRVLVLKEIVSIHMVTIHWLYWLQLIPCMNGREQKSFFLRHLIMSYLHCYKWTSSMTEYSVTTVAELWYTFEPIKIGKENKYTFDTFWYIGLISFHAISYNLDMIFYHQSLFDTLLSVSKCIW